MNNRMIHSLIDFYIQNAARIHSPKIEGYKWTILSSIRGYIIDYVDRHYKDGEWDQDFSDFHEFTRRTIGKTDNLVYSSSRSVMQKAADKYPELVRQMFIDLSELNSEVSLKDRICDFIKSIDDLAEKNQDISKSGKSFHQDYRAVSVYLLMLYPDLYYNYMYSTFAEFAKFVEIKIPKAGDINLLPNYYDVCDEIRSILLEDYKYKEWFEDYLQAQKTCDSSGHLLVQDIVFSLYYYFHPEKLAVDSDVVIPKLLKKKPIRRTVVPGNGVIVDYEARQKRNTAIGRAAENFVLENERRLVASYGLDCDLVKHVSKDPEQGDGLGYDIISCDKDGHEIYIEVKGTTGGIGAAFYITEAELQCSIMNTEKYRLYRVYDFIIAGISGRGKIAFIEGSLKPYCINTEIYKVMF